MLTFRAEAQRVYAEIEDIVCRVLLSFSAHGSLLRPDSLCVSALRPT
ncbi:MAG: hypothetical protein WBP93_11045 [Pyrinomonadaceae bacterium]